MIMKEENGTSSVTRIQRIEDWKHTSYNISDTPNVPRIMRLQDMKRTKRTARNTSQDDGSCADPQFIHDLSSEGTYLFSLFAAHISFCIKSNKRWTESPKRMK